MIKKFPSNFIFGVAESDLQVIGEKYTEQFETSLPTMWGNFTKKRNQDTPDIGIERYNRWSEDIELMKQLGIKHYRGSVSMTRILDKEKNVNKKAILWYKNFFKSLQNAGIKIYITLYHWELPEYLSSIGGWVNKETIEVFLRHSEIVMAELGEFFEEVFILNEPRCCSLYSYYTGWNPPGKHNISLALQAAHNLLLAQGLVFRSLHERYPKLKLSTVIDVSPQYPYSQSEKDIYATKIADEQNNLWYLDPIFFGKYPEFLLNKYKNKMCKYTEEEMELIKIGNKLNSLGLNYYHGNIVKYVESEEFHYERVFLKNGGENEIGWPIFLPPIYPEGLFDILNKIYQRYENHGLNTIYITENGYAGKSTWNKNKLVVEDPKRITFLKRHLDQINKAIEKGIPIKGYFVWTLMDNFEWNYGYDPHSAFGLIYIDRKTMKRIPKSSALWYKDLIKTKILK